jgi:hypothetical protein
MATRELIDVEPGKVFSVSRYSDLTAAITAIGAVNNVTLLIDEATTITANTTVTSNIGLKFLQSGQVTGAFTLTINGPIDAPPIQIFDSAVTVVIGSTAPVILNAKHFATINDVASVLRDEDELVIPFGTYSVTDTVQFNQLTHVTIHGTGVVVPDASFASKPVLEFVDCRESVVSGFTVKGNGTTAPVSCIRLTSAGGGLAPTRMKISDMRIGADGCVDCIDIVSTSGGVNNEFHTIENTRLSAYTGAGIHTEHSNPHQIKLDRVKFGPPGTGGQPIIIDGGSVYAERCTMSDGGTPVITISEANNLCTFVSNFAEGTQTLLSVTGNDVRVSFLGNHFKINEASSTQISVTGTGFDGWFAGNWLMTGASPQTFDFGTDTNSNVTFVANRIGGTVYSWNGRLTLVGNKHEAGTVTLTPGASAKVYEFGNGGGSSGDAGEGLRIGNSGRLGSIIKEHLRGTRTSVAASDYSSNPIPANGSATFTITVTGTPTDGSVFASPRGDIGANLTWSAYATADTVTVRVSNPTGSTIAPTTRTWDASVWDY